MGRPFLRPRPATLRASSITASTKPPGRLQSATTGTKALWNFVQTEAIVALEPERPSAEEAQLCPRPTAPKPLPAHRIAVPTTGRLRSPVTTHAPRPDAAIWRAVSLGRRSSPRNLRNFCLRDAETSLSPRARLRAPVPCVLQTARLHAVPVAWRVARPRRFVCLHDCRPAAAGAASGPHALGTRRECGPLRGAGRRPPPRHGNCDALQTSVLLVCLGLPKG